MHESTVNQRLASLINSKKITQVALAKALSITPQSVSSLLSGETKPRYEVITAILSAYPDVSPDWLISGTGGMYRESVQLVPDPGDLVPYFSVAAIAGNPTRFFDAAQTPTSYLRVPGIERGELALSVSGDSMLPVLAHGDIIVCRKAVLSPQTIFTGFYVVCFDDSIVVKSVRRDPGQPYLHLISSNPQYPPIVVPAEAITQLYQVLFRVQCTTF